MIARRSPAKPANSKTSVKSERRGELQWEWVQDLHIKSSTTCVAGLNTAKTPQHALRRFLDGDDVHELEFEAALCGLSDLFRAAVSVLSLGCRAGATT